MQILAALNIGIVCPVQIHQAVGECVMNRRQLLTNTVSGIGVLAVAGLNAPPIDGCDNEKAKSDKNKEVASVGQECPIYPYMFHGTWDSYYAMTQTADTPSAQCDTPRSLDAVHNLVLGCGGTGCARAVDVRLTGVDDEHDVSKAVDDAGSGDMVLARFNSGASFKKRDDIKIEVRKDPQTAPKSIWVRLFEIEFNPKLHDPDQPGLKPADSALLMKQPIATMHLGHEVRAKQLATGDFGEIITPQPMSPVQGRKHVFKVQMRAAGIIKTFTVLVKKFA